MKGIRSLSSLLFGNKLFWIKDFSLENTVFIFTVYLALTVSGVSIFINIFLNLPFQIQLLNISFGLVMLFIYWLSYFKRMFKLSRALLHIIVSICINFLWFETAGSAGASSVFFMAYIPLTIFFTPRNSLITILIIIAVNLAALFSFEIFFPEWIKPYTSDSSRSMDIMFIIGIFLFFEIPLLKYAKEAMINERNKAIDSEERKTSMIANLSHEIRTPMNAILGFTELLSIPDLDQEDQKKYIQVISQNGKILLQLLNNIINHSKLESNNIQPSISIFTAESILAQVYDTLEHAVSSKDNLEFTLNHLPQNNTEISTDFTILYQILLNITYNAFKFTDKGKISLGYDVIDGHIHFSVKDTGRGIPDHLKPHIFKQFRTGDIEDEHLPMQGAGLGLAICKGLTSILKGDISYLSEVNVGTQFIIRLPINWNNKTI